MLQSSGLSWQHNSRKVGTEETGHTHAMKPEKVVSAVRAVKLGVLCQECAHAKAPQGEVAVDCPSLPFFSVKGLAFMTPSIAAAIANQAAIGCLPTIANPPRVVAIVPK